MDYKTLKNNYEERSEAEHKDLIVTANKGVQAIQVLTRKYGDITTAAFNDGMKINLNETDTDFCLIEEK